MAVSWISTMRLGERKVGDEKLETVAGLWFGRGSVARNTLSPKP